MGYRILADEHVGPHTRKYPRQSGHDVEWVGDVPELGLGSSDEEIAIYSLDRLVLTQDDDFLTVIDQSDSAGILYQRDQTLTGQQVGEIVDEISRYLPESEVEVEYVSRSWITD